MNIRQELDNKLAMQAVETLALDLPLSNAKLIAQWYTRTEHCISVLSDLKSKRSYIYNSELTVRLGLDNQDATINSIWEDALLDQVHPDDLKKKYRLELQFFQKLKKLQIEQRANYEATLQLRIKDRHGKFHLVRHRLLYLSSGTDGSIALALCLYNTLHEPGSPDLTDGHIIDKSSGQIIPLNEGRTQYTLSAREKSVLRLIKQGHSSKQIAALLSLSVYTVNRHRQNVYGKLNVTSALEACNIAEAASLF